MFCRWNVSDFSECSQICGGGNQNRTVDCIQEVSTVLRIRNILASWIRIRICKYISGPGFGIIYPDPRVKISTNNCKKKIFFSQNPNYEILINFSLFIKGLSSFRKINEKKKKTKFFFC